MIHFISAVCSTVCQNGGTCTALDTCSYKEGFYGYSCEIAGCAKPEGNLVNLEQQFYYDGETITITNRTCKSGYLPNSGSKTLACKNGQLTEKISCVLEKRARERERETREDERREVGRERGRDERITERRRGEREMRRKEERRERERERREREEREREERERER
ncbi:hypothetical protein DPMN_152549 [Dreissena polymorpha]|uniref:EGF-like domain-containing protein n=1 Tax=Dreissena polymorpha TaxID=45954 RepID=A0A9D4FM15_DREPO|nr:hypothetical protein DPMN_152549 [Dreissena polymorpha]